MIIGKTLTISSMKGLQPLIVVSAMTGSTVTCDGVQVTEASGTWTFVTTIGTHTIVATNPDQTYTRTKSVVVSSVMIYTVNIVYELYLYNAGDECSSTTGTWGNGYWNTYADAYWGGSKQSTYIQLADTSTSKYTSQGYSTQQKIDLTDYSTLHMEFQFTNIGTGQYDKYCNINIGLNNTLVDGAFPSTGEYGLFDINLSGGSTKWDSIQDYNLHTLNGDISNISGLYYIAIRGGSYYVTSQLYTIKIHRIWMD